MKNAWKYFSSSVWVTIIGLILGGVVGYYYTGTMTGVGTAIFLCAVLSVLEISISFDNAVVNAIVLKDMTPVWQHRFLTWGMWIAVFGMRLVFPLLIVSILAKVGPIDAFLLAATQPEKYKEIMLSAHYEVAAFGGAFLLLVSLKYFFDVEKDVHWIRRIEEPLAKMGRLEAIEVGLTLAMLIVISKFISLDHQLSFIIAGLFGVITYLAVQGIGTFLQAPNTLESNSTVIANASPTGKTIDQALLDQMAKISLANFLYLEVLDASFSFDGVIGAFAITNNLFIIAIGLGIGAMFVRSLTIMMVDKGTLEAFKYLEHGAFYAVCSLAIIIFLNTLIEIPELITGAVGAIFIGLSIWSSHKENKATKAKS
jgi:hypothetical protein